jgi:hypothetical protein
MPLQALRPAPFKPPKDVTVSWNTWRKGWNNLLRENEAAGDEMVLATNIILTGSGVPTKRWGSLDYFSAGATGYGRFVLPIKDANENIQVLAMTDWGVLTKKSGASYTPITGASWASGYNVEGAQLGGKVYLVSASRELVKYDFSTLTGFPTIAKPASLTATNLSSASGLTEWSWRISAVGRSGGETLGSTAVSLASLPQDLSRTTIRIRWVPVSAASGDLVGYNVYRGAPGDEVWVGGVDNNSSSFDDTGFPVSDPTRTSPLVDTTGGPKAKYILRFQDRLVMAGVPGDPTLVIISGRYPQQERFDWLAGGGKVWIEPDSGESIIGLATYYQSSSQSQTVIVFKERSVWELRFAFVNFGNYTILDPQYRLLTASQGCSSHRTISPVENDIMFMNRKGVYILRYEPQLTNVINANEISAKIRTFFEGLTDEDLTTACAAYYDKRYVLSFPVSKQWVCFDRERLSFTGPWPMPFGVVQFAKYVDASGNERLIGVDSDDKYVTEFSKNYVDDKGTPISTIFKTKKEDFGDWTIFKTINEVFMNFKSVVGDVDVNIYIEERSGRTVTAKSFSIEGPAGFGTSGLGTDMFGGIGFGESDNSATTTNTDESPKRALIYKVSRTIQAEIRTTGRTDNYELLGIKVIAIPQARGNAPSSWTV